MRHWFTLISTSLWKLAVLGANLTCMVSGTRGPPFLTDCQSELKTSKSNINEDYWRQQKSHCWNHYSTTTHFHRTQRCWTIFHQEIQLQQPNVLASSLCLEIPLGFWNNPCGLNWSQKMQKYLSCLGLAWNLKFQDLLNYAVRSRIILWTEHRIRSQGVFSPWIFPFWNIQMKGAPRNSSITIFSWAKEPFAHTVQYSILGVPLLFDVNPGLVRTIKTVSPGATALIRGQGVP